MKTEKSEAEMPKVKTAMDVYFAMVYRWIITIITGACVCAGVTFSLLKVLGFYPSVSWIALIIFVGTCLLYVVIGQILIKKSIVNGVVKQDMLPKGKVFVTIILLVQFNFILYMIPSKDFWAYIFFFLLLAAFFLDNKMITIDIAELVLSLAIAWIVNPSVTLPVKEALFVPEMVLRVIGVVLSTASIWLITFFVSYFLANAKKDEIEKNNQRVQNVLNKVTHITGQLGEASNSLVLTSQTETASTEELSAISENLLENSSNLLDMAEKSKKNLAQLESSSQNMETKMQDMNSISKELVDISTSNEQALNNLMRMSTDVEKSTNQTRQVTDKLLEESGEIGKTLDIINDLAESINLLALNASIEAARAGEAGRGFAVVAQEVGHLADSTKESLNNVNEVVTRVQRGTHNVSDFMNQNAEQLLNQNKVIVETVEGIRRMMRLLKTSVTAIEQADEIKDVQNKVIQETVSINENIANGIQQENAEFSNIADMVHSNTEEILVISNQVETINTMINELDALLEE